MKDERIAVVEGIRTPFTRAGGALKEISAAELGRFVIRTLLDRAGFDEADVDELIMGSAFPALNASEGANVARLSARLAGLPPRVLTTTIHRGIISGCESIRVAFERLMFGRGGVMMVGGAESFSRSALFLGKSTGKDEEVIELLGDLQIPYASRKRLWGEMIEATFREFGVTREEQDRYTLRSHMAATASKAKLQEEIHPYAVGPEYGTLLQNDTEVREGVALKEFSALSPCFDEARGTVTEGNSAALGDGAALLLLMREDAARKRGLTPLGYIRAVTSVAFDPARAGLGPAYAIPPALRRVELALSDIQLFELDESFAGGVLSNLQAMSSKAFSRKELGWIDPVGEIPPERLNLNGGSLSLGCPGSASGVRMVLGLLKEMKRRNRTKGIAAMDSGEGQGMAFVLERDAS